MKNAYITLVMALVIAAIAGWFSVAGLMALYSASATPILIMGAALEGGKLAAASWIYRNWEDPWQMLVPWIAFVAMLMLITSMGIFGFLSKAHAEQDGSIANAQATIERLNNNIQREQRIIDDADIELDQLDEAITILQQYDKISGPDGSRAVRQAQKPERDNLKLQQSDTQVVIDELLDERFALEQTVRDFEKEIGPVKYLAALLYDDPANNIDGAIQIVTMMLIFVFDPLAVWLLIAANRSLLKLELNEQSETDGKEENNEQKEIQQTGKTRGTPDPGFSFNSLPIDKISGKEKQGIIPNVLAETNAVRQAIQNEKNKEQGPSPKKKNGSNDAPSKSNNDGTSGAPYSKDKNTD